MFDKWPPLAWAAQCFYANSVIVVYHGAGVEVRDNWFCEAVWNNNFETGDFDLTDIIFGSGARIRTEQVTFVSSGTTVDRLQALTLPGSVWISNSLACLLSVTDNSIDPAYPDYFERLTSITQGLDKYEKNIKLLSGEKVQLSYFNNLVWNGSTLVEVEKPNEQRDFSSFTKYHDFLLSSLKKISDNTLAAERKYSYEMLGTLSSGYDSATITVLAQKVGLRETIPFLKARGGDADNGKEIANALIFPLN